MNVLPDTASPLVSPERTLKLLIAPANGALLLMKVLFDTVPVEVPLSIAPAKIKPLLLVKVLSDTFMTVYATWIAPPPQAALLVNVLPLTVNVPGDWSDT